MKKILLIMTIAMLGLFLSNCSLHQETDQTAVPQPDISRGYSPGTAFSMYFETEYNDTLATANGPLNASIKVCGNTGSSSNQDWFKFNNIYSFNFYLDGYTYYLTGYVYNASGTLLGTINYRKNLQITYPGTIYVKITGYDNISYNLFVTPGGQNSIPDMNTIFETENNSSFTTANGLYNTNLNIRGIVGSSSDLDYFKFDCIGNSTFYLDGYTYYISGTVYDANYNYIGQISYRTAYTLNYNGVIYVAISGYSGISYNLKVSKEIKTKHVVVVVMDGVRYSETWGDTTRQYIPNIKNFFAPNGAVLTSFYATNTVTETIPGHTALTTSVNQLILNDGTQNPANPGIMHYLLQQYNLPKTAAMNITSKDKLIVLARTAAAGWTDYTPFYDCGIVNPDGTTAYREDSATDPIVEAQLFAEKPRYMIINYKDTDSYAHALNYTGYTSSIRIIDGYAYDLWTKITADADLNGTTTMFIVNDHGRHTGVANLDNNYQNHGDSCDGCRHILCVAIGPDIKTNIQDSTTYDLRDVTKTAAYLLGINMPTAAGKVMKTILK